MESNCISEQSFDKSDKRRGKYVIFDATLRYAAGHGMEVLSFHHVSDMKRWNSQAERGKS